MNSSYPDNPIAAAMHPDPYPYYAELIAKRPLYRDERIGAWVASSAQAVTAVLNSELCRVRPCDEPVPKGLLGSPVAEIFKHLIRMNDGVGHCPLDRAVSLTLASVVSEAEATSARIANELSKAVDPNDLTSVTQFAFHLSGHVIGALFGIPSSELPQVTEEVGRLVRCIFGSSDLNEIERGKEAAAHLLDRFEKFSTQRHSEETLLIRLTQAAIRIGCEDQKVIIANSIGFFSQAYEATAGLISNSLLALNGRNAQAFEADPSLLRDFILEVLRFDPPNHSTRRFLAADGTVGEYRMNDGDAIVVVLAAANRDPSANADPNRFEPNRKDRKLFTFGRGLHACPGDRIALHIVIEGVRALLKLRLPLNRLAQNVTYRVSPNTHIPLFG